MDNVVKGEGFKALEKKSFTFGSDGKLAVTESMNGQTSEWLKEDWQFDSWGTYTMKGDTVYLHIEREKCDRQIYTHKRDNKWVREEKPTYDSTITNGAKDRFMTWDYFEQWLTKKK